MNNNGKNSKLAINRAKEIVNSIELKFQIDAPLEMGTSFESVEKMASFLEKIISLLNNQFKLDSNALEVTFLIIRLKSQFQRVHYLIFKYFETNSAPNETLHLKEQLTVNLDVSQTNRDSTLPPISLQQQSEQSSPIPKQLFLSHKDPESEEEVGYKNFRIL